jgi:hypothetical protein
MALGRALPRPWPQLPGGGAPGGARSVVSGCTSAAGPQRRRAAPRPARGRAPRRTRVTLLMATDDAGPLCRHGSAARQLPSGPGSGICRSAALAPGWLGSCIVSRLTWPSDEAAAATTLSPRRAACFSGGKGRSELGRQRA